MFITCQTSVRYVVPNIHLCADIKDPSVNGAGERSAILMTLRGCHQWQYIHAVFHKTSQYESVKADCCGWIGLQRDRSGSLVMVQEHIHLYIKTSYYALPDVNMPFLKQRTLSQFAHSNYYCRWSLTNSGSRTRTFTTSSNKSYHYTPTRASPIT
jgi:hypothetical protein